MEDQEALRLRITLDPHVLAGKPTIRGLRLSVEQVLAELAAGVPEQEILEEYPGLEPEDIRAALLYARVGGYGTGLSSRTAGMNRSD